MLKSVTLALFVATVISVLAGTQQSSAATMAERIKSCLNGVLSETEKGNLLVDLSEIKNVFSDYVRDNIGPCYKIITGEDSLFKNGEGIVVNPELLKDIRAARALEKEQEEKAKALKAEVQQKRMGLMKSSRCVEDKSEEVTRLLKVIVNTYRASNTKLINDRTHAACIDLHSKDENSAILNETCRDIFEAKFHPDFEMESLFDRFDKLTNAAERLDRQKIEIQA